MKGISRTSAPSLRNSWESDPAWCRALPTRIRTPLSAKVVGDSCLFLILARAGLFDFAQRKVRPQRFSRLWRGGAIWARGRVRALQPRPRPQNTPEPGVSIFSSVDAG